MHPHAVLLAQPGDLRQRVDRAEVGGAAGGDDGHGDQAVLRAALQLTGEGDGLHALVVVDGDRHDRVGSEAEQFRGLLHAEVADLGGEDAQVGERFGLRLLAGQQERLEVGLGAARGEHPVGRRAEADPGGRPVDQFPFDERAARRLVPGVQGGVDGGQYGLAEHRRYDDRAVEVGEVAGVVEVDGVAQVDVLQLVEDRGRVVQGPVEVDPVDAGGEGVHRDTGERAVGGGDSGGHPLDSFGHGAAVLLRGGVVEQVRAHVGVLRWGRSERGRRGRNPRFDLG
ncbi:hypothetical protein RKD48_005128 [Streptomyces ambofaciens]